MSRDSASLLDIAQAGQRALQFAQGLTREQLSGDVMRQSAILYQITIVGEATKRLSQTYREKHPEIPWRRIAGMRDIIAHQDDRVNFDTIWEVIHQDIPKLLAMIAPLLPKEPTE